MDTRTEQQEINPKNYIFKYDPKKKNIYGYKIACSSVEEVKNLDIANLESEKNSPGGVRSGFIKFSNEEAVQSINQVEEAKWVLRFEKGNPAINEAWKILVNLVEANHLWDIKASAKTDEFPTQIICVYVADPNNLHEIVSVYNTLVKHKLIALHMQQSINDQSINFIKDKDTRLNNSKPTYTNASIEDLHKLYELRDTVSETMFNTRWEEFATAIRLESEGIPLPNDFKRTYFSNDEANGRLDLLTKINDFQINILQDIDVLNDIIKNIRATLTSNYKFSTVDLLNHGITLINNACPKQSFLASIYEKDPAIQRYNEAIAFFGQLMKDETLRLAEANLPANNLSMKKI